MHTIIHKKQWNFLEYRYSTGHLAHAYLLSGLKEVDKKQFATAFIQFLSCSDAKKPCKECNACRLIQKHAYPDFITVKAEQEEIEIKQIRDLQNFLSYRAYYDGYKAAIIEDAERMTVGAQNCFLKTLEEPKGRTVIFLLSSKPDRLLSTIFSRCQQIKFFYTGAYALKKDEQALVRDLKRLIASDLVEKFQYAKKANLDGNALQEMLHAFQKYFRSMLLSKIGLGGKEESGAEKYSVNKLRNIITLTETLDHQLFTTNVNKKLALEILLMEV